MNLATLYSVPLWQGDYPNFDEDKEVFISAIEEYKNQNPSIKKSNIFGYHSPETLHHVSELEPLFQYICQMAFNACQNLDFIECDIAMTSAWLNVNNTRQCMNSEHIHEDTFSGVFYLKVPEGSGSLAINNPSINRLWDGCKLTSQKNEYTAELIRIEPVEGSIILFPSYLPHYVETNDHDDERISISFNIIALPKGTIDYSAMSEK